MFEKYFIKRRKKSHFRKVHRVLERRFWDLELLQKELKSVREGIRQNYDRLKEQIDAAERRLFFERYDVLGKNGEKITANSFQGATKQLQDLSEEITDQELRKKKREDPDKTICENLEKVISTRKVDIEQMKNQMLGIDKQIEGIPNPNTGELEGVVPSMLGVRAKIDLVREYRNNL